MKRSLSNDFPGLGSKGNHSKPKPAPEVGLSPDPAVEAKYGIVVDGVNFVEIFAQANLANLNWPPLPMITGHQQTDDLIRHQATERGYRQQPGVADESQLTTVEDNHRLQPQAAAAYWSLKREMASLDIYFRITSSWRNYDRQRLIFTDRLGWSESDQIDPARIEFVLETSAPPGYSKHHSGYVIDVAAGNLSYHDFVGSDSYQWLAADNFANSRRFGFIPSYPNDGRRQGPDPEPWEFCWVGDRATT